MATIIPIVKLKTSDYQLEIEKLQKRVTEYFGTRNIELQTDNPCIIIKCEVSYEDREILEGFCEKNTFLYYTNNG